MSKGEEREELRGRKEEFAFTASISSPFRGRLRKELRGRLREEALNKCDALCHDVVVEEHAGTLAELGGRFGGVILAGTTTGEPLRHFGMTAKIVFKAGGDVLTLRNDFDGRQLGVSTGELG